MDENRVTSRGPKGGEEGGEEVSKTEERNFLDIRERGSGQGLGMAIDRPNPRVKVMTCCGNSNPPSNQGSLFRLFRFQVVGDRMRLAPPGPPAYTI